MTVCNKLECWTLAMESTKQGDFKAGGFCLNGASLI